MFDSISRSSLQLAVLLSSTLLGCPHPTQPGETGDSGGPDTVPCQDSYDDPTTGLPDLRCTQAANDSDYFWFAREAIEAAEHRVHVIEYLLYDSGLAEQLLLELVDAAERGVEVKVLADEASSDTEDVVDWLRSQAGGAIQAKLDSGSTTSHNKLIIADDVSLVGSHNMSSSALASNHESSMYLTEADVTAYYEDYFQSMWANSDNDPALTKPSRQDLVPIKNREIYSYLEGCMDGAQERVRLVMYALVYYDDGLSPTYDLAQSILAAHSRGLDVAVVLDQSDWIVANDINDAAIDLLRGRGVPLRVTDRDTTTHAKMLLCDDTVIVGDANWSYSSMEDYNGTSVQVGRPAVAQQYIEWFEEIWEESEAP